MDWIRCKVFQDYRLVKMGSNCFVDFNVEKRMCFSSCGHLMCANCLRNKHETVCSSVCIVCQRSNIKLLKVNNQMKPELKFLFSTPYGLFNEFSVQLKKVLEFQQNNRMRLKERQNMEKLQSAGRQIQMLKMELKKSKENEHIALIEQSKMKAEMERHKEQTQHLRTKLVDLEKQAQIYACKLQMLQSRNPSRVLPSLNGNTPLMGLSFSECAMSTPNNFPMMPQGNLKDANTNLLMTPILNESEIAGPVRMPDTPAMFRNRKSVAAQFYF